MNFQTDTCPLCGEVCQSRKVAGTTVFNCPTPSPDLRKSHYEVEINGKTELQRIIVYPYAIDSFSSDCKSRVYYLKAINDTQYWKLIMEVSLIRAESESKLLERLTTLVTFL